MKEYKEEIILSYLFILGRLILIVSFPYQGLLGYGDLTHYYQLAALGTPMIDVWVEFPPIFVFISRILYQVLSGRENSYVYSLVLLLSICQAASILIFAKLFTQIYPKRDARPFLILYFTLISFIPFGWWQFDSLVVLTMLLGLYYFQKKQDGLASICTITGILLKFFPVFLLPTMIKRRTFRKGVQLFVVNIGCVLLVFGLLYYLSPKMTQASLAAQLNKGSWETVWALLDGNLDTGNFGPYADRFIPGKAFASLKNPALIDPKLILVLFGFIGFLIFIRYPSKDNTSTVSLLTITWCVFLLWSPGWSPQWILYLIPLFLLSLPDRLGILLVSALTLVNILEWPILLSRGYNWGLWFTIPVRTLIILFTLLKIISTKPKLITAERIE